MHKKIIACENHSSNTIWSSHSQTTHQDKKAGNNLRFTQPQNIAVPVSIFPTHSILVLRVSYQLIFSRNEHVKQATLKDQYSCIRKIRSETLFMVLKVVIDRVMF